MFKHLRAVAFLLGVAVGAHGQSIITVAGGGSDDGQLATNIALNGPSGLALDGAGNLYVAETSQGLVRRVNLATGTVETIAGIGAAGYGGDNGPAKKATLKEPRSLFLDQNGDLYIADHGNERVRKIDGKTRIITTVAGRGSERADGTIGDNGPATEAVLRGPWGVWIDRGNLYITEDGFLGQRVRKVVFSTGIITTIAGPTEARPVIAATAAPPSMPHSSIRSASSSIARAIFFSPIRGIIVFDGSTPSAETLRRTLAGERKRATEGWRQRPTSITRGSWPSIRPEIF